MVEFIGLQSTRAFLKSIEFTAARVEAKKDSNHRTDTKSSCSMIDSHLLPSDEERLSHGPTPIQDRNMI